MTIRSQIRETLMQGNKHNIDQSVDQIISILNGSLPPKDKTFGHSEHDFLMKQGWNACRKDMQAKINEGGKR